MRAIGLEFRKMRRLRTVLITAILVLAVAGLATFSLFAGSARKNFNNPDAMPWGLLMLTYTFIAAMTSPILTAVLASRQTDIEHSGAGWTLASTAGYPPGILCRAKLIALSVVLVPALIAQTLLVVGIGIFAGIRVPVEPAPWIRYTILLFLVDVAFLALHIWLSAVLDNQLVCVGIGMLGAFLAGFMLLTSVSAARLVPWGYYAMISLVGQQERRPVHLDPPYEWIAGFLILMGIVFTVVTRRLDRIER